MDNVLLNLLLIVSVDVDDLLLAGSAAIDEDLEELMSCLWMSKFYVVVW